MALLDQLKQKVAEREIAGQHPLLSMKVDRNVCDAYFSGIVFAALVDDNNIDAEEERYISMLGIGLGLPEDEVHDTIKRVTGIAESADFVQEIAEAIKEPQIAKLFLAEFSLIWTSHTSAIDKLMEWRNVLVKFMSIQLSEDWFALLDAAMADTPERVKSIAQLSDFDSATIKYLFGDVNKDVADARNAAEDAARKQREITAQKAAHKNLEEDLCKLVESERSINIEEVNKLINDAEIKEHQVTVVLKLLLPHARKAFDAFIVDIPNLAYGSDSTDRTVVVAESIYGRWLQRYITLFDKLTTKAKEYSVILEPNKDELKRANPYYWRNRDEFSYGRDVISYAYGKASFNKFSWSWRSNDGHRYALKAVKELFDRAISEFEFRATF